MKTRTGSFPIGFRRGWSDWQKELEGLIAWVKQAQFQAIDLGKDADTIARQVIDAGLRVGSADLAEWQGMISADAGERRDAVARNSDYVRKCAELGVRRFFLVMLPKDPQRERAENFADMVDSFGQLAPVLESCDASIVIEGWPGPGALCCTPETYRALFREVPSPAMGVNYDPSHLVRLGVDPMRFLREFIDRVHHVHGKDTALMPERLYELGSEQPATFAESIGFGGNHWRYCIPGHGVIDWVQCFELLAEASYPGCVCIELEDANFNGSEDGEKRGLQLGGEFLTGC